MWTEAEKDQFYKALSLLAETMGEPLSPVRMAGYCAGLEDAPFEAVMFGVQESLKVSRFFPKPAELRELGLESSQWRKLVRERREEADRKALPGPPPLSREEVQANINRLKDMLRTIKRMP